MYQEILNNQPFAIASFDKDGKYIYFNDKELDLRDLNKAQVDTNTIFDLFDLNDQVILENNFNELFNLDRNEINFQYTKENSYFNMRLIKDNNNHIISTTTDITEQIEDKEDIKRLDDAVRGANIGFWDFFPQEGRILANETWVTQKKYKDEDFREDKALFSEVKDGLNKWASIVHPDDLEATGALIEKHLNGETDIYEAEFRMMCGDGQYRWIYDLGRVFQRDEDGTAIRMNGVHIDITKIKELQSQLKEQAIELEKSTMIAQESTKSKSQFLANMSHEIRTPMNGIIGMSHLALQTNLNEKQRNYIQKIDNSAKSLLGIINDILDFSKIEAGKLEIEKVEFDLFKVIDSVIGLIEFKAHEKNLEIIVSYGSNIGKKFYGDPLRIQQILTNLMSNAVKFTNSGEIGIYIHQIKNNIFRFEVKDTGIGLSIEQQDKLFQSFSQADGSTTRKYGGTGLGLTISKQLVELMNGKIWVESKKNIGSDFIFELELDALEDNKNYNIFKDKKVLIVDDNHTWHKILENLLESFGVCVDSVISGEDAIYKIDNCNNHYDLILMDWNMPHLDGIETAKIINDNCKKIIPPTIIMVSAFRQESIVKLAFDAGIDIFLQKPINPSILHDILSSIFLNDAKLNYTNHFENNNLTYDMNILQGSNILLIEDNIINQEIILGLLEHSGIIIDIANNGKEGVDKFTTNSYDLILMDLQMPVMGGIEATKIIRKISKDIPIIALTANAMKEDIEKTEAIGMNEHLSKPIEVDKLYEILLKYISKKSDENIILDSKNDNIIFPQFRSIDVDLGLKYLNGNKKLYLKILNNFKTDYKDIKLDNLDDNKFELITHTIKGLSASIGAVTLNNILKELDSTKNRDLLPEFYKELNTVLDELKNLDTE